MNYILKYIAIFLFCFFTYAAVAQVENSNNSHIEKKAILLSKKLNNILKFNDYQKQKATEIYLQYLKDFYFIMNNNNLNNAQLIKSEKSLNSRLNLYLQSILTDNQKIKYNNLLKVIEE